MPTKVHIVSPVESRDRLASLERLGLSRARPDDDPDLLIIDLGATHAVIQAALTGAPIPALLLYTDGKQLGAAAEHFGTGRPLVIAGPGTPFDRALAAAVELVDETPAQNPLDKKMPEFRRRFAERFPKRATELSDALRALRESEEQNGALGEARRLAHSLKGSAATFGFADLAALGHALEEALTDRPDWPRIDRLNAHLQSHVLASGATRPWVATLGVFDDDDAFVAKLTALAAEELVQVNRVREAADLHDSATLDGLLIDAAYDASSGREPAFVDALARDPLLREIPLAFYTHREEAAWDERIHAQHAGGRLFLANPLDRDELTQASRLLAALRRYEPARIMAVDDDPEFMDSLAALLTEEGFQVCRLQEPENILDALARERPELLLLDVMLPRVNGFDVCRMLRTLPAWQDLPVLFLTARTGPVPHMDAIQAGGDDFITKPIDRADIVGRIRQRVNRFRLLRERLEHDRLTGLETRAAFVRSLTSLGTTGRNERTPFALAFLDLDRFKEVNDRSGHAVGDRVLVAFGALLLRAIRRTDRCARWGGDEFALALPGLGRPEALDFLERLRDEWAQVASTLPDGAAVSCSFSAGVSFFPDEGSDLEALLRKADGLLRHAKAAGRDRVFAGEAGEP